MIYPLYIRSPMGSRERLTDYTVQRDIKTTGDKTLDVIVELTDKNLHSYPLVQNQGILTFRGEDYVIKQITETMPFQIEASAISKFFEDLGDMYIYTSTSGAMTIEQMLGYCLAGTGYTYTVDHTGLPASFNADSFGASDSLSLFQQVMTDFGTQFSTSGKVITIAQDLGRHTDNQFRYRLNMSNTQNTIDTSNLKTFIRAYGKQNDDGSYAAQVDYTSPLAATYGVKHADPFTDDACTDNAKLLTEAKQALNDTIPFSIQFDYSQIKKLGIQDVQLFDYGWLHIDPWGINMSTQISEMQDYADSEKPATYTFGNILIRSSDTLLKMQQQAKLQKKDIQTFGGLANEAYGNMITTVKVGVANV